MQLQHFQFTESSLGSINLIYLWSSQYYVFTLSYSSSSPLQSMGRDGQCRGSPFTAQCDKRYSLELIILAAEVEMSFI